MNIDIRTKVKNMIEQENRNKKEDEKIKISSDLERVIEKMRETIRDFENHYSFGELKKELDKMELDSDNLREDIEKEIKRILDK